MLIAHVIMHRTVQNSVDRLCKPSSFLLNQRGYYYADLFKNHKFAEKSFKPDVVTVIKVDMFEHTCTETQMCGIISFCEARSLHFKPKGILSYR